MWLTEGSSLETSCLCRLEPGKKALGVGEKQYRGPSQKRDNFCVCVTILIKGSSFFLSGEELEIVIKIH